jgi:hypothetical protein
MAYVDPRKKAVTPTPYAGVVPPPGPIQGPPSPVTPSLQLAGLNYKTFLNGRASAKPLAIQFAKLTKNTDLLKRLTAPAPVAAAPPPTTPQVAPVTAPTSVSTPVSTPTVADAAVVAPPSTTSFSPSSSGSLPMPTTVPVGDVNALFAPAERSIASQRSAALAAQNKAFQDNLAFEQFIQNTTGQANQALAGTLGQLSSGAALSRQQSVNNLDSAIGSMQAAAGGPGGDLGRLAGSTAAGQSNQLLQAGQSALNAVPDVVGQAALKYGQDQQQVGAAQGRVMNDAAIRATQGALGDVAQQQTSLDTSKASAQLSLGSSIRDYMVQTAQLDALNRFNSGKLTEQGYGSYTHYLGQIAQASSRVDVAKIKSDTSLSVADRNNLSKIALQHNKDIAATNRTLITTAAKRAVTSNTFGAKAVSLVNSKLNNLPQDIKSQSRFDRGQTVRGIVADLKNAYGANNTRPNGLTYQDAYSLISGIPQAGSEALKDPSFVAFLKTQFPQA